MTDANLSGCILEGVDLRQAILWNANLRGAVLNRAILADACFNGAKYFSINQYMTGILFWNTIMPDGSFVEGSFFINGLKCYL